MKIKPSKKLENLTGYAFAEVDKKVAELKDQGVSLIDFGVGDPQDPTPDFIRNRVKIAVDEQACAGYPSYIGSKEYRETIASWNKQRFDVDLDPSKEIISNIGAKEFVFNFPQAFINSGDIVLIPNPGYPPYNRGTTFAGGEVYYYNLTAENNFLPNLDEIPDEILKRSKILWINYPNNPTAATIDKGSLENIVKFCHKHNIILASDEAYTEIYFDQKPTSILEITKEGVIAINSLSKRSNMTCYRVGWAAGDEQIISQLKKLKTNIDSGTSSFIQDAAITALSDEQHVEESRKVYKEKHDILMGALQSVGLKPCPSKGTLYMWQRVPAGFTSVAFAQKLLNPELALVTTPGSWLSVSTHGINPGEGYVRFALTPTLDDCKRAAQRIKQFLNLSA